MCIERYVRMVAGIFVLASLLLTRLVSPWFTLMTVFVGLNLFQSSLTGKCPLQNILRALRVPSCDVSIAVARSHDRLPR